MKIIVYSFILLFLLSCSSRNEEKRYYYQDGSVFRIERFDEETQVFHVKKFYKGGQLYAEGDNGYVENYKDWLDSGYWKGFFPDGFPKEAYTCVKGTDISPRETGIYSGYDIRLNMGETIYIDSVAYEPMRFFVDGISRYHYRVAVMDGNNRFHEMKRYPQNIKKYQIKDEGGNVVNSVTIDETMYDYLMPNDWFYDFVTPLEDDLVELKFAIHFPDTTCHYRDSIYQAVTMHVKLTR